MVIWAVTGISMVLVSFCVQVVFSVVLLVVLNSRYKTKEGSVTSKTYVDCCDIGLNRTDKENCDMVRDTSSRSFKDALGVRHQFVWSDCIPGQEPWRKFDTK